MSHSNISIFIPHLGCPCKCSFCNQVHITSHSNMPDENEIKNAAEIAKNSKHYNSDTCQLAYFGGSFTAIEYEKMVDYLKIGYQFVANGDINSIRISTRPDAINQDILNVLKKYGVKSIELGAQSMSNEVLYANNRGHNCQDVINASSLIKENGFELGLQMMTGLYKSDANLDMYTAKKFVELKPSTVRVYPTIVLENTELARLYRLKQYNPQTLQEATTQGAAILKLFYDNNINVIRFGLHSIDEKSYVAGPWHPSISEIAQSQIYFNLINEKINDKGFYKVFVNSKELSKAIGQKKINLESFKSKGIFIEFKLDNSLKKYEVIIKKG